MAEITLKNKSRKVEAIQIHTKKGLNFYFTGKKAKKINHLLFTESPVINRYLQILDKQQ